MKIYIFYYLQFPFCPFSHGPEPESLKKNFTAAPWNKMIKIIRQLQWTKDHRWIFKKIRGRGDGKNMGGGITQEKQNLILFIPPKKRKFGQLSTPEGEKSGKLFCQMGKKCVSWQNINLCKRCVKMP